jgi:predicted amidohydrolase YtcJ
LKAANGRCSISKVLAIGATALCVFAGCKKPQPHGVDMVLLHGHIYTSNPQQKWAEAVAISDDKIVAVGTDEEIARLQGKATNVIDLGGKMAMPGIIDDHTHFLWGSQGLAGVQLAGAKSVDEVRARLKAYADSHHDEAWAYGGGWEYGFFPPTGMPTRQLLDEAFPDKPAAMISGDGHSLWVNTKALEAAKITKDTPDQTTEHGSVNAIILRDKTGAPSGVLEEGAKKLVLDALLVSDEQKMKDLQLGLAAANQTGITSVMNATGDIPEMELYEELHRRGLLTVRMTTAFARDTGVKHTLSAEELADFESARQRFHSDWNSAGVIKFFADGVIETHTAAMLEPYANTPGNPGKSLYTQQEFDDYFHELDKRGFQIMTHAIGDKAVRMTLDGYAKVAAEDGPRDRRWRIEHIETIAPSDVPRFAKEHVVASIQSWCCPAPHEPWMDNAGEKRAREEGVRWRDLVDSGAVYAFGSDWPVSPLNPFDCMQAALTRQGSFSAGSKPFLPDQALTVDQLLTGYTINSAYAEFADQKVGSLQPGKLADVIVLSQDLTKVPATDVSKTQVVLTVVGGKVVWRGSL